MCSLRRDVWDRHSALPALLGGGMFVLTVPGKPLCLGFSDMKFWGCDLSENKALRCPPRNHGVCETPHNYSVSTTFFIADQTGRRMKLNILSSICPGVHFLIHIGHSFQGQPDSLVSPCISTQGLSSRWN